MDVYERVTDTIMAQLEAGTVPWRKPWKGTSGMPKNLVSKKHYRGINVWLLAFQGRPSAFWLTFKQAKKLGGFVKKGEKGSMVVFADYINKGTTTVITKDEETGEEKTETRTRRVPFMKAYTVFNLSQCEGIADPDEGQKTANVIEPLAECERLMDGWSDKPPVRFDGGDRAFYRPATDEIHMPVMGCFESPEGYYATLFHEAAHATGHKSRLDRRGVSGISGFGSEVYSQEELVAEMGAAFLCGLSGIENKMIDNAAAYIKGWLEALKNDRKLVIVAAAQAQKAADYITARKTDTEIADE